MAKSIKQHMEERNNMQFVENVQGKKLGKQDIPTASKPKNIRVSESKINEIRDKNNLKIEKEQREASKKKTRKGIAKLAAGTAAIATGMYYGLTKTVGGETKYTSGGQPYKTEKKRIPIWQKE